MWVTLVQTASDLDPAANRALLRDRLDAASAAGPSDLVVFPEAFARDFGPVTSSLASEAEPVDGPFGTLLEREAAERGVTVVAGMFETSPDPERPFNTLLIRGDVAAEYRKVHLYDSFGYRESDRLTPGPVDAVTVPFGDLTLGLMTCYDLRFPEQARALVDAGADVLVVPAAWVAGERKVDHWLTLARARAIENTVWVVAVGQPAPRYTGHSVVVDPLGDVVAQAGPDEEVLRAEVTRDAVTAARETNPSLANRRR